MCHELTLRGIPFECEKEILIPYKGTFIAGQRYDLLVGQRILTELKAVTELHPLYEAKLLSYLKAMKLRLGLIINFHVPLLKDGIQRVIH